MPPLTCYHCHILEKTEKLAGLDGLSQYYMFMYCVSLISRLSGRISVEASTQLMRKGLGKRLVLCMMPSQGTGVVTLYAFYTVNTDHLM